MKLMQTTALILATAVTATAVTAQDVKLYDVDVKADLTDFTDSNALKFWPNLEADLQRAIVDRVKLTGVDEDPRIEVLVSKVSVDGDTFLPDSGEFNQLEGVVAVYEGESAVTTQTEVNSEVDTPITRYPLRLYAQTAEATVPEGWTLIPPSTEDFYNAMVQAFADKVVEDFGN